MQSRIVSFESSKSKAVIEVFENGEFIVSTQITQLGYTRTVPRGLSKGSVDFHGYYKTTVCGKPMLVHRLIAYAFLGLDLNSQTQVVRHSDGNPKNNNVSNLCVGTQKDNVHDTVKMGRVCNQSGSQLQANIVESICDDLANGMSGKEISLKYNISTGAINAIKQGRTHKHITSKRLHEIKNLNTATKISNEDVVKIKSIKRHNSKASSIKVGKTFGVHPSTITDIWNGKRYKDIKVEGFTEQKQRDRSPIPQDILDRAIKLRKEHYGITSISRELGIEKTKLARAFKKINIL